MAERVLVTGARAVAALDIARSLRAAGYEPHLADCSPARLARWSVSGGAVHRYASPVREPARFAADIRALIELLDPVLIIPACEEVFHLAALAETDGFARRLLAPDLQTLAVLHAKDAFAELCADLGLHVPATRMVVDRAGLDTAAADLRDVVLKPVWSRFGSRTVIAASSEVLAAVHPSPEDPWVVQRRIAGDDVSFHAVCHDGRLTAFAAYGSDWRVPGGAACAFAPLPGPVADRLRVMADALAARIGRGQFACDAVVDAGGQPWLIECNPRATSGVHLFARSAAFGHALLGRGEAFPAEGGRHIAPALWRYGLPGAAARGKVSAWLDQRRDGRDVLSAPGDPWPVLGALADTAGFALRAARDRISLTEAMTADIEWNGRPFDPDRWSRP